MSLIGPGASDRGLVGAAGVLVTRVVRVSGSRLFVDASRTFLPKSSLLGPRRSQAANRPPTAATRRDQLAGRTANSTDVLATFVALPTRRVGDLLVLSAAGAYSISRASEAAGDLPDRYALTEQGDLPRLGSPVVGGSGPLGRNGSTVNRPMTARWVG